MIKSKNKNFNKAELEHLHQHLHEHNYQIQTQHQFQNKFDHYRNIMFHNETTKKSDNTKNEVRNYILILLLREKFIVALMFITGIVLKMSILFMFKL